MKAYVIKSNNDEFYLSNSPFYKWTNDFCEARIETDRKDMEQILDQVYRRLCNGKIVEITITENDLEQQLAEKDKEIERLKQCVMSREQVEAILKPEIADLTKQLTKEITPIIMKKCRHQVCDEIRERARLLYHYQNNNGEKETVLTQTELFDVLQQIEKGDE